MSRKQFKGKGCGILNQDFFLVDERPLWVDSGHCLTKILLLMGLCCQRKSGVPKEDYLRIKSSAIWLAFRAAPLRKLSDTIHPFLNITAFTLQSENKRAENNG